MKVAFMKCRILTFVASALAILATAFPVCVGGGYGADLAWMNVTTVGGGVPVAAGCSGTVGREAHDTNASVGDYIICGRFQNTTGCGLTSLSKITLYIDGETNTTAAKMAVYADNAGAVGSLLFTSAEFNPSAFSSAWYENTSISGSGTIANNAYVWLCLWADGASGTTSLYHGRSTTGGTHAYYSYDYSTNSGTFPATGGDFSTDGVNIVEIHIDGSGS